MQSAKCKYDVNRDAVIMPLLAKYSMGNNCISVFDVQCSSRKCYKYMNFSGLAGLTS